MTKKFRNKNQVEVTQKKPLILCIILYIYNVMPIVDLCDV
jgi:hypothetical protein